MGVESTQTQRPTIISLALDDDTATVASLNRSEEEKFAFVERPFTSQPVGTQSGKQYLRQYDQTPDGTQQPTTSGTAAPLQAPMPLDKEKQKEVRFDKSLKKNPSQGLTAPFSFNILA